MSSERGAFKLIRERNEARARAEIAEKALARLIEAHGRPTEQDGLLHPAHQVFFRAGLLACREYMARFIEAENPLIAGSIRANWWPSLGADYGPPRKLYFGEVTVGEYGSETFRVKTLDEVSPTQEALPIAADFLALLAPLEEKTAAEVKAPGA